GAVAESALTAERAIELTDKGLPSTFVPGRNLAFFVYAAALADRRGATRPGRGLGGDRFFRLSGRRARTPRPPERGAPPGRVAGGRRRDAADAADQGADLGPGKGPGRRAAGGADRPRQPHLLPRRTRRTARLGLWLRRLSGLRAAGPGLGAMDRGGPARAAT